MGPTSKRPTLAQATAVAGVLVGLLMAVGGLALIVALLSSEQASSQWMTAVVLIAAGAIIVGNRRGIRSQQASSIRWGLLASALFLAYSGLVRDFGELFWMVAVFLLLITTLLWKTSSRPRIAA